MDTEPAQQTQRVYVKPKAVIGTIVVIIGIVVSVIVNRVVGILLIVIGCIILFTIFISVSYIMTFLSELFRFS
jgi:hypothetical protein